MRFVRFVGLGLALAPLASCGSVDPQVASAMFGVAGPVFERKADDVAVRSNFNPHRGEAQAASQRWRASGGVIGPTTLVWVEGRQRKGGEPQLALWVSADSAEWRFYREAWSSGQRLKMSKADSDVDCFAGNCYTSELFVVDLTPVADQSVVAVELSGGRRSVVIDIPTETIRSVRSATTAAVR